MRAVGRYKLDEDIMQEARIAAVNALSKWSPDLGASKATFVDRCVRNRLRVLYRFRMQKRRRAEELSFEATEELRIACAFLSTRATQEDDAIAKQETEQFWEALQALPQREANMIRRRLQGFTLREISEGEKVTRQRMEQLSTPVIELLRVRLARRLGK